MTDETELILNPYPATFEEGDNNGEYNSFLHITDYDSKDLIPKAMSTELLCMELHVLKVSLLEAIDPSLKNILDLSFSENEDSPQEMINKYFETNQESHEDGGEDNLQRLQMAKSWYQDLNAQIEWITSNATMIRRVFCPYVRNQEEKEVSIEPSEKTSLNSNGSLCSEPLKGADRKNLLYGALYTEMLCVELLALKDAIFVALDPSLENYIDLSFFEDTDSPRRLIDKYFNFGPGLHILVHFGIALFLRFCVVTDYMGRFREDSLDLKRLNAAESLHHNLSEQVNWMISNACMIRRVFFPHANNHEGRHIQSLHKSSSAIRSAASSQQ